MTPRGEPISELDLHLFAEGKHLLIHDRLGAHRTPSGDAVRFAVWAPNARAVSVIGDFNGWQPGQTRLSRISESGIWEAEVPGVPTGAHYKLRIDGPGGYVVDKADPFARFAEVAPQRASIVWEDRHVWRDEAWMRSRGAKSALSAPMSVYEVHLGSFKRRPDGTFLGYRDIAAPLAEHVKALGFTHVELMPVMEHPFYGSWGYQVTGYFAPTSRYGTPDDLRHLIDTLHQAGIGVILDWVPSHFPSDEHGLGYFDGTHLFEHADPRLGYHPDWNSCIFNYGRHEVRSFLLSSAMHWLTDYHADGLRVDAVASMLYRDYSRQPGQWIPNKYGGRENLEAISLLRELNEAAYAAHPDVQIIAEESTSWPLVSRPLYVGGLGFGLKWDMGWMHDTLAYFGHDPVHRAYHHGKVTFRQIYAQSENFLLPFSHDEVVHGKGSLLGKMPGDRWQRFANLRLLYALLFAQSGKKLLFMGAEHAETREWNHDGELDWSLVRDPMHAGVATLVADLNRLYAAEPAMHARDCLEGGFEWIDCNDAANGVVALVRRAEPGQTEIVVILSFTPVPRHDYRVGLPHGGRWTEVICTDATAYGGSGVGNLGGVTADEHPHHGRPFSALFTVPPLGALFLRGESPPPPEPAPGPLVALPSGPFPSERRSGPYALSPDTLPGLPGPRRGGES